MSNLELDIILSKSRKLFLVEAKKKLVNSFIPFLNYSIHLDESERYFLENLFHSIKGMAAISGFDKLESDALCAEQRFSSFKDKKSLSPDEVFSVIHDFYNVWSHVHTLTLEYFSSLAESETYEESLKSEECLKSEDSLKSDTPIPSILYGHTASGLVHKNSHPIRGNLLIVDDDTVLLDLLNRFFTSRGYIVHASTHSKEAMETINIQPIDLILIDIMLPQKNGFTFYQQLKDIGYSGGVIILSGKNLPEDRLNGLKMGADDYITKPFNLEELFLRVQKVIEKNLALKITSSKDSLTEVYNKEHFYKDFKSEIALAKMKNILFSVVLIDIDNFREINREHGYFIGDMILKKFSVFLQESEPNSKVYRFEGDKFLMVFKDLDSSDAYYTILKILNAPALKNFKPLGKPLTFSSSLFCIRNPEVDLENIISTLYETLEKSKGFGDDKITIMKAEKKELKLKILIVEDLSATVYLIKKHLERLNCEIYQALDGVEAIKKCQQLKPDIVLLDLMLPRLDGYEVCKTIKNEPELKHTKIIVVSSKNSEEDILHCFKLGVDDFISKPFSLIELEKRIKRLL